MKRSLVIIFSVMVGAAAIAGAIHHVFYRNGPFIPESNQSELSALKAGSARAVSSIRSGRGKVTVKTTSRAANCSHSEAESVYDVLFIGDKFKYIVNTTCMENDPAPRGTKSVSFDGKKVTVFRPGEGAIINDRQSGEGNYEIAVFLRDVSVQRHGIWDMDNIRKYVPFPGNYAQSKPKIIGREIINGNECTVVEVSFTGKVGRQDGIKIFRFWIDPKKGYTMPRIQTWGKGGFLKEKTLVQERNARLRNYGNGIWGPTVVTFDEYVPDPQTGKVYNHFHSVTTYDSESKLNVNVSSDDVLLKLPSRTRVYDN